MRISVIVPALNEETALAQTLQSVLGENPFEVIVVDGGSKDRTVCRAALPGVTVIHSPKGRARQMNAGALQARGDVFLFLHADTRLPTGALNKLRSSLSCGAKAGRFRMRFDDDSLMLRCYSWYTRFPFFSYGDQGFFVTRSLFESLNGFDARVPFEDIDFYRRAARRAHPVILPLYVLTSARRFRGMGPLRQKWINLLLVTLFFCGIDISILKSRLYPDIR